MSKKEIPKHYLSLKERFPEVMEKVDEVRTLISGSGPIDEKTSHFIQLAGAAGANSEGSVHSHVRRAIKAGATKEELYHCALLLISTLGFPRAAAIVRWIDDVVE